MFLIRSVCSSSVCLLLLKVPSCGLSCELLCTKCIGFILNCRCASLESSADFPFLSFRFDDIRIDLPCLMYAVYKFTKYFTFGEVHF